MKKIISSIIICSLFFNAGVLFTYIIGSTSSDNWWDSEWSYRQLITIDSSQVESDLVDFPVLIYLPSEFEYAKFDLDRDGDVDTDDYNIFSQCFNYSGHPPHPNCQRGVDADFDDDGDVDQTDLAVMQQSLWHYDNSSLAQETQDDGDDIVFVSYSDTTKLSHEIEFYNGSSELVAWVKIPHLSSSIDTKIWMYYGNPSSSNQQDFSNVWDSNYVMVQHLNEPTGNLADSTSNGNNADNIDAIYNISTKINGGYDFDGDTNYLNTDAQLMMTNTVTYGGWIKWHLVVGDGSGRDVPLQQTDSGGNGYRIYALPNEPVPLKNDRIAISDGVTHTPAYEIHTGEWYYVVARHTGTHMGLFVNGVLVESAESTTNPSASDFVIGGDVAQNTHWFEGTIDEVRVSNIARSDSWIKTSYDMMNNPTTFLSLGDPEEYVEPVEQQLVISAPSSVIEGGLFDVIVTANDLVVDQVSVTFADTDELTDSEGTATFTAPEVDANTQYTIIANKEGYTSATKTIIVENSPEPHQLIITAPSSVNEGETFDITVTADNLPNLGVIVTFNGLTYSTNEDGEVTVTAPDVNQDMEYPITVSKEGYLADETTVLILNQEPTVGSISGIISDFDGKLLQNVKVCIGNAGINQCIFTDANGYYNIPEIQFDMYTLSVSKFGYKPQTETIVIFSVEVVKNIVLEKKEPTVIPSPTQQVLVENTIEKAIASDNVGAFITILDAIDENPTIEYYGDDVTINIGIASPNNIIFTAGAEEGTEGKLIILHIEQEGFSEGKYKVKFDGEPIDMMSIDEFLNPGTLLEDPKYIIFSTEGGPYLGIYIPTWSEHTITISTVIDVFTGIVAIIFYLGICIVAAVIVAGPMIVRLTRRIYFQKER